VIPHTEPHHDENAKQQEEDESKQDENLLESNLDFGNAEGIDLLDGEESTAPSTIPVEVSKIDKTNKYELFERLLSFLNTD
jgi:hypothetical protein